jgi:hypothetical protein
MENLFIIFSVTDDQPLFPQEHILPEAQKSFKEIETIQSFLESIQDTPDRGIYSDRILFDQ